MRPVYWYRTGTELTGPSFFVFSVPSVPLWFSGVTELLWFSGVTELLWFSGVTEPLRLSAHTQPHPGGKRSVWFGRFFGRWRRASSSCSRSSSVRKS